MSMLDLLSSESEWNAFYEYKTSLVCPGAFEKELREFIDAKAYLPVCERMRGGERFPLPRKAVISKLSSRKKRTVYIYPRAENNVLKLLTYLLLRKYDGLFSDGLYSFRPGRSAKDAIRKLVRTPGMKAMHAYKVDISNYFNSVPVERFLPLLEEVCGEDGELQGFLAGLLSETRVLDGAAAQRGAASQGNAAAQGNAAPQGNAAAQSNAAPQRNAAPQMGAAPQMDAAPQTPLPIIEEQKGIMAGCPLSAFFANLYLADLDRYFEAEGVPYARYSDDIIVFAESAEKTALYAERIRAFLAEKGLSVNPDKEEFFGPDGWVFLGFSYRGGVIDIAPATVKKLKGKMRRKARALRRWAERNGVSGEKAARAFIRIFNRKLLESAEGSELSWSYWFFSVINTDASLKEIDAYAQDCIRFIASGRRTKARFRVKYEDLKALGYRSLVNEFWK